MSNRFRWSRRSAEPHTVDGLAAEIAAAAAYTVQSWVVREATRIVASARGAPVPFAQGASLALVEVLAHCWTNGWQPVDVWQVLRRQLSAEVADVMVGAIAEEAARSAAHTMHPRWRAQLAELGATPWWRPDECFAGALAERDGLDAVTLLTRVIEVLGQLRRLPPQPLLIPPPGSYTSGQPSGTADAAPSSVDPKMLAKVRGLLAKAESTDFPEEADAFFAKAQELMSRYSLERAALFALDDGPKPTGVRTDGRRIWLDSPYVSAKSMLVATVASANHCKALVTQGIGFVTVLGEETDAEIVEVLTTSLLVQASRAMVAAGKQVDRFGQSRTKSFRQSFLVAYAGRIGERLTEASHRAESEVGAEVGESRLLPVLAAKERAVEEYVAQLFPRVVSQRVSVSNSAGWQAGRAAADLAVLDVRRAVRK